MDDTHTMAVALLCRGRKQSEVTHSSNLTYHDHGGAAQSPHLGCQGFEYTKAERPISDIATTLLDHGKHTEALEFDEIHDSLTKAGDDESSCGYVGLERGYILIFT